MTYITLDRCAICGGNLEGRKSSVGPYFDAELAPGFSIKAGAMAHYQQCVTCKAWMQNPRMDNEQIARYYADGIYRANLNISEEVMDEDERRRAKIDAAIVEQHFGAITSHLDIGCSRGYFLGEVQALIQAGVEPNMDWVLKGGITVVPSLENIHRRYDLVSMIHVLEHEAKPLEYLMRASQYLADGGVLMVEVPSWASSGGPLRLAHLWMWEAGAMRELANRAGLRVKQFITTPHLVTFLEAA